MQLPACILGSIDEETFGLTTFQATVFESQGEAGALAMYVGRCDGCMFDSVISFTHGLTMDDTTGAITGVAVANLAMDGDGAAITNLEGYLRISNLYGTKSSADTGGSIVNNGSDAHTAIANPILASASSATNGDIYTPGATLTINGGQIYELSTTDPAINNAGGVMYVGAAQVSVPNGTVAPIIVSSASLSFHGTSFSVPNSSRTVPVISQTGGAIDLAAVTFSGASGGALGDPVVSVGVDNAAQEFLILYLMAGAPPCHPRPMDIMISATFLLR